MKQTFMIFICLLAAICEPELSFASPMSCERVFSTPEEKWRPGNDNLFMAFRSNAPHFWSWARQNAASKMPQSLLVQGIVAGDAHALNFGQLLTRAGKLVDQLIDLDDAGRAPLVFDVIRLMISVRVSPAETTEKEVWKAYVKGLEGKEFDTPQFIEKANDVTEKEFLGHQQRLINHNVKSGKLDLKEYGLSEMKIAPSWLMSVGHQIRDQQRQLDPDLEFVDWGWMLHANGGSQGMSRIWMLFKKKNGDLSLREFKQMAPPATDNYEDQVDHENRIPQVQHALWKEEMFDPSVVVIVGGIHFLSRNRFEDPLNDDIKAMIKSADKSKKLDELSAFIAYRLGQLHAQQPGGRKLLSTLERLEKEENVDVIQLMKTLSDDYLSVVKAMMKQE